MLGAITEVTCGCGPAPQARRYEGWIAADFEAGRRVVRDARPGHRCPT